MFWLPPGRFSTTTGCGQTLCSPAAIERAMVSGEPPGVSGTMIRIARSGKPCAQARQDQNNNPSNNPLRMTLPRGCCNAEFTYSASRNTMAFHRGGTEMSMLSPEELEKQSTAETSLFPAPIPVQSVSSDEFMPLPQTAKQREFEARVKEM